MKFSPGWRQRLLLRSFISLSTVFVTLLAAEAVVRLVPFYPAELSTFRPGVGFVYIPEARGVQMNTFCWGTYRREVAINGKGLYDREHTYESEGKPRILVLGDSFVAAHEVPFEETFHSRLERSLGIDAISAGHSGWGTDNQLLWYLDEGHKYEVDLVLLVYQPGNDVQDNSVALNLLPEKMPYFTLEGEQLVLHRNNDRPSGTGPNPAGLAEHLHRSLFANSFLYRLYVLRGWRLKLVRGELYSLDIADSQAEEERYQELYDQAFDLTFHLVAELRDAVEANGDRFAVAIASSERQEFAAGEGNQREKAALEARGIPSLDLLPAILAAHSEAALMHFPCDGHWTAEGHEVVAGELEGFLVGLMERSK